MPFIGFPPFPISLPSPLPVLPGMNYWHPHLCLKIYFWGNVTRDVVSYTLVCKLNNISLGSLHTNSSMQPLLVIAIWDYCSSLLTVWSLVCCLFGLVGWFLFCFHYGFPFPAYPQQSSQESPANSSCVTPQSPSLAPCHTQNEG